MREMGTKLALLLALSAPMPAHAEVAVTVSRLPVAAEAAAVLARQHDARFEELAGASWRPVQGPRQQWFRIDLPAALPARDLVLALDRVPLDVIEVHLPVPGGGWTTQRDGAAAGDGPRQSSVCCYAFPLPRELPGGSIYLSIEDAVPSRLQFRVSPWDEYAARDRTDATVAVLAVLVLLSMALANGLFFALLRERDHALLVGAQLAMAALAAQQAGLLPLQWGGAVGGLVPWVPVSALAAFLGAAFIQSYCGVDARWPRYARAMRVARWVVLAIGVLAALVVLLLPNAAMALRDLHNVSLVALALFAFATPVLALRGARRPAVVVMLAWAVLVVVLVWKARYVLGFGEADWLVRHGVQVGVVLVAVVLSLALAERALDLRQQRDRADFQRHLAESRLRVAQTRRALSESLEGLLQHAGNDLSFTAYKRALAALRRVVPARGAVWVGEATDGSRVLVAEPAAVRDKVAEFVRRRAATLRSVAQTGRALVLSPTDTDQTAIDGTPLKAAVVPLRPDGSSWSVLLLAREQWQDFAPEDFEIARDFLGLAARAAAEGSRHASLQQKASFDALTGALNRGNIETTVEAAFGEAVHTRTPLSVLFIDLDHFKRVNDLYGHTAGDDCLLRATQRIGRVLKPGQAIGRYGGEEFLVALPGVAADEAQAIAERIRECVRERPVTTGESSIPLTVSIGGASRQPGELSWKHMLERADQAVYSAKRQGRDRVVWGDPVAARPA
jgi:diguanylate cyclase (GGDEF)-like protein